MNEPASIPELVAKHLLTPDEHQKVLELLNRGMADLASAEPRESAETDSFRLDGIADTGNAGGDLRRLLAAPEIAAKGSGDRRDREGANEGFVVCPGSDAVVLRFRRNGLPVPGADAAPAPAMGDGPGSTAALPERLVAVVLTHRGLGTLDPLAGNDTAIAAAGRRLACTGSVSVGSIPFGTPPVPTPAVAVVGIIDEPKHLTTQRFKDEGDAIILLGTPVDTADPLQGLGGSAYLKTVHGQTAGRLPQVDLEAAKTLHTTLLGLIHEGVVKSAHGCHEGGLAVALAESCLSNQTAEETVQFLGATVDLSAVGQAASLPAAPSGAKQTEQEADAAGRLAACPTVRLDALLFGEAQNRVVLSVAATDAGRVVKQAQIMGVPAMVIGKAGGDTLSVKAATGEFSAPIAELHAAWWNSIARAMA